MFKRSTSKKDNKRDEKRLSSASTVTTVHRQETLTTITHQRSISVSSTGFDSNFHESISLPTLQNFNSHSNNSLIGFSSTSTKNWTSTVPTKPIQIDAKPSINLNYKSPYRGATPMISRSYNQIPSTSFSSNIPNRQVVQPPPVRPSEPPITLKSNKGKLTVKKTGVKYDTKFNPTVPTYKTSLTKVRGHVLIINNIMFKDNKSYRSGAECDDKILNDLFTQMQFKVKLKRNLKAKDIEECVKKFSRSSDLKSGSISIVIVMSHGTNRLTLGGYTEIIGVDEAGLPTDKILDYFNTKNCPHMALKPKIFIFQCCRGDNEDFTHQDVVRIDKNLSNFGDMLVAFSSLPGFVSHRDPNNGTWYIQTLCEVFSEHSHSYDVEEMLKIVDAKLSRHNIVQTSSYENRGFKKCYLHP